MQTLGVIQVSPHLHRERPYPIFLQAKQRLTSINSQSYIESGRTGKTLSWVPIRRCRHLPRPWSGGGRVWAYTASEVLGWTAGLIAAGVAGLGWRALARRAAAATDVRFPGESQVGLDESEFFEIEETDVLTGRPRSKKI